MGKSFRPIGFVAVAAVAALGLAACGSSPSSSASSPGSSGKTVAVDVGTGTPVKMKSDALKVGIFMNAMSNSWQQNLAQEAKKTAEGFGWKATVVDFNFDQAAELAAMQSAATQHTYDAITVVPIDGNQVCKMATQTLPQANVLTVTAGNPICGRDLKEGDAQWSPGSYSHNTVAPSMAYDELYLEKTAAMFPAPQTAALVVGAEDNGTTIALRKLVPAFEASHPGFKVADYIHTDFTTPNTYTAVQAYLQAHRDTTLVMSVYSPDLSRGAVQALTSLRLQGKVKMTDMGGGQYSVDQIKAGTIQMSIPYYPVSDGAALVQSIKNAQDGKTPTRLVDDVPGGLSKIPVVTKLTVSSFTPQY